MREDDSYVARENVRAHNARTEVTTSFAGMILLHGAENVNQSQKTAIKTETCQKSWFWLSFSPFQSVLHWL